MVTAVLPDGEVLYTQHSTNAENLDLQAREPIHQHDEGDQHIEYVRPKQTWAQ